MFSILFTLDTALPGAPVPPPVPSTRRPGFSSYQAQVCREYLYSTALSAESPPSTPHTVRLRWATEGDRPQETVTWIGGQSGVIWDSP
jgi:hypothetical protein